MDGHFVPNISFGLPVLKSIRSITNQTLDAHLMISHPSKYIKAFAENGADIINFHIEVEEDIHQNIEEILRHGKKAALTIKPNTNIEALYPYLDKLHMVLIMSVEPGFGGQKFMPAALDKARALRKYIIENNLSIDIQMDGGITLENVKDVLTAGVNVVVAGSSVFGAEDVEGRVKEFLNQ